MPDEVYEFSERTYENLAKAQVAPLAVLDVLYGRQWFRRHLGAGLQVAGKDHSSQWLGVALIETHNDHYLVTSARYLDVDEIATIRRIKGYQS
jgi:hypothetical protein